MAKIRELSRHIVIDARIRRASTGRYIDRLVEHLQKIDSAYTYTVLVQPDDTWQPSTAHFKRADCKYPQFSFNPLQQLGFARQLYRLKADLVHFPMNQQPIFYFKPVITSTMDLTMLRFTRAGRHSAAFHAIRMAAYRFLFWYSLRKSKAVITISEFVKKDVEEHYPFTRGRIAVTYCASEPLISDTAKSLKGVQKPYIMHVGSPFPHKNIDRLVEAFGLLKEEHPDLQLVLAGKKELYFEKLENKIKALPYEKDIVITGFISDSELKWLYENTSAYVLPSMSEGFGLPGLEAMTHGAPVISSDATCLPEIYGSAAHYFDPTDSRGMAAAINDVINDNHLRDKLIRGGYQQIKKYSWRDMASATFDIYNSVLH